ALFGRRLRVERVDRRRSGQFVHVEVLPGVFMVVAAWMLDAAAAQAWNLVRRACRLQHFRISMTF
ncbi:hypothetical protein, partial [Cereibacter changlensis]|uniref:hypothetical protein n=1 Tax=Cereibacter changlensis TaxID=402884 RepID=UPI001B8023C1